MSTIFIGYRRDDGGHARALYEKLLDWYDAGQVFLAVIGPHWLSDKNRERLQNLAKLPESDLPPLQNWGWGGFGGAGSQDQPPQNPPSPPFHKGGDALDEQRRQLAHILGGLPLALEQACAYILKHRVGIAAYCREVENWQRGIQQELRVLFPTPQP